MPAASDLERMMREAGLRVTRPRAAVLAAVLDHPHADTDSIRGVVRRDHAVVSHQALHVDRVVGSTPCLTSAGTAGTASEPVRPTEIRRAQS